MSNSVNFFLFTQPEKSHILLNTFKYSVIYLQLYITITNCLLIKCIRGTVAVYF